MARTQWMDQLARIAGVARIADEKGIPTREAIDLSRARLLTPSRRQVLEAGEAEHPGRSVPRGPR